MRKLLFLFSLVASLGLISCSQDEVFPASQSGQQSEKMHKITVVDSEGNPITSEQMSVEFLNEDGTRATGYDVEGAGYVADGGSITVTLKAQTGYNLVGNASYSGTANFDCPSYGNTRTAVVSKVRTDVVISVGTEGAYSWTVTLPEKSEITVRNSLEVFYQGSYPVGTITGTGYWPLSTTSTLSGKSTTKLQSVTVDVTAGLYKLNVTSLGGQMANNTKTELNKEKNNGCPVAGTQTVYITWTGNVGVGIVDTKSKEIWVREFESLARN